MKLAKPLRFIIIIKSLCIQIEATYITQNFIEYFILVVRVRKHEAEMQSKCKISFSYKLEKSARRRSIIIPW